LEGASLVACVQDYFTQSEQIGTALHMAVGQREDKWRGCVIMLQHLPEEAQNIDAGISNLSEDDWRRAMVLLQSASTDELLDEQLTAPDLLFRLFHEEGVRVFEPQSVARDCRCTSERIENVVRLLPAEDREHIVKDGRIEMTCEFCSKTFRLDPETYTLIE
jgi:molecular chaperone Hsp33